MQPVERAHAIARAALERKAEDVVIMRMRELTPICDFFVICSGRSSVHVQAIADQILMRMEEQGVRVSHVEGLAEGRWVLLDYLTVVTHIFLPEEREYYALEQLWADAPREAVCEEASPVAE